MQFIYSLISVYGYENYYFLYFSVYLLMYVLYNWIICLIIRYYVYFYMFFVYIDIFFHTFKIFMSSCHDLFSALGMNLLTIISQKI